MSHFSSSSFPPNILSVRRGRSFRETLFGKVRYGSATIETSPGVIGEYAVVIKEYERELVESRRTRNGDLVGEDAREELRLHAALSVLSHPNLVRLWDVRKDEQRYYAILEFCSRGEFFPLVQLEEFSASHAKFYFRQLIKGIQAMHSINIFHRDLSLENILMASSPFPLPLPSPASSSPSDEEIPTLKICDFGVAVEWRTQEMIKDEGVPVGKCVSADTKIRLFDGSSLSARELWKLQIANYSLPSLVDEDGHKQAIRSIDCGRCFIHFEVSSSLHPPYSVTPTHSLALWLVPSPFIHSIYKSNSQLSAIAFNQRSGQFQLFQVHFEQEDNIPHEFSFSLYTPSSSFSSFCDLHSPFLPSFPSSCSTLSQAFSHLCQVLSSPDFIAPSHRVSLLVDDYFTLPTSLQVLFAPLLFSRPLETLIHSSQSASPLVIVRRIEGEFDWIGFEVSSPSHTFVLDSGVITCNCRFYMAPEVLARQYYSPALYDVWCCGIILFVMLTRVHPFKFATPSDQRFLLVVNGGINQLLQKWERPLLDPIQHDLLCKMLALADRRISVDEILQHPFVTEEEEIFQDDNQKEFKMEA
jgi:serine/threonine protein kinase